MAARKSPAEPAAPPPRFAAGVSAVADLADARAQLAQLAAALEAEHKLAGELGVEKAKLEEAFEAYKREAQATIAAHEANCKTAIANMQAHLTDPGKTAVELAELRRENPALREHNNRLLSDILAKVAEVARLQDQLAAFRERDDKDAEEVKRLRRELIEASGDVALHRVRDERAHAALAALALRYGDLAAEMFEREDDEALTQARCG